MFSALPSAYAGKTRRQGDTETRGQGDWERLAFLCPLVPLSPCPLVFFFASDHDLDVSRDFAMKFDGRLEFARLFDRFFQLHAAAVDLVAFGGEGIGDVHRGDRAVEDAVLADFAREF